MASEPAMLDRALDDGVANATSAINMDMDMDRSTARWTTTARQSPTYGPRQGSDGRMGQGKVYLLDETPAILHHGQQDRIRGDPVSDFRGICPGARVRDQCSLNTRTVVLNPASAYSRLG